MMRRALAIATGTALLWLFPSIAVHAQTGDSQPEFRGTPWSETGSHSGYAVFAEGLLGASGSVLVGGSGGTGGPVFADGSFGTWSMVGWYHCPTDAQFHAQLRAAWDSMPVDANTVTMQPPAEQQWVFANMATVVMVDTDVRMLETTILDTPVTIRAQAGAYRWDWGNGDVTVTSDPGKPWPDYTVAYSYPPREAEVEVNLTTTWTGTYSIDGGPWQAIDGTITTTTGPFPLTVFNPHSHRVNCDLNNNCSN